MGNINFEIKEEALVLIEELLDEAGDSETVLTICSSGTGCGGPLLKLEMRAPLDNDIIVKKEGFTFHIRENISNRLEGAYIEKKTTFWGDKLNINNGNVCLG